MKKLADSSVINLVFLKEKAKNKARREVMKVSRAVSWDKGELSKERSVERLVSF